MSLHDDLSESGESWGSDFEESFKEEVTEEEFYEVLGKPNEGVGAVCFVLLSGKKLLKNNNIKIP